MHATLSIHLAIYLFQKKWNIELIICNNKKYNTHHSRVEHFWTHVWGRNMRTRNDQNSMFEISIHPILSPSKNVPCDLATLQTYGLPFKELLLWQHAYNDHFFFQSDNPPKKAKQDSIISYLSLRPASVTHSLLPYDDPCQSYLLWSLYLFFPKKESLCLILADDCYLARDDMYQFRPLQKKTYFEND